MDEDRLQTLESRVATLEQQVLNLFARLPRPAPSPVIPPPARLPDAQRYQPKFDVSPSSPRIRPTPIHEMVPKEPAPDNEFTLGAKVLPRVGASLVILGIGFLISIGIQRGIIGPWVQFASAMAVSLAFLVFGFRLRDSKAEFGHVLMAVGSSGLFLTTAGGHAFGDLYPADGVVAGFLCLGLAHLAYALHSASRTFFVFGLLGGVAGALLPLQKANEALAMVLLAVVIAASATCALRHGWRVLAMLVSVLAFGPTLMLGQQFVQFERATIQGVALLFASGLLTRIWESDDTEPSPLVGPLLFAFGAVLMAALLDGRFSRPGFLGYVEPLHVAAFIAALGVAAVPVALVAKDARAKHGLWISAACVATLLSPALMARPWDVVAFTSLLVASAFLAARAWPNVVRVAAGVYAIAASAAYLLWDADGGVLSTDPTRAYVFEVGLLAALAVGVLQTLRLFVRDEDETLREFVVGSGIVLMALATLRVGVLSAVFFGLPIALNTVVCSLLAIIAIALNYVSRLAKFVSASYLGLASLISSLVLYAALTSASALASLGETALIALLLAALFATHTSLRNLKRPEFGHERSHDVGGVVFGFVALCLIARCTALWMLPPTLPIRPFIAAGVVFAAAACALFAWRRATASPAQQTLSWIALAVGAVLTLPFIDQVPDAWRYAGWMLMIAAWVIARFSWRLTGPDHALFEGVGVLSVGFYLTTLVLLLDLRHALGLPSFALVSLTWTVYGATLLVLGFAINAASLRKWAIGGFMFTAFKVVLVDLSMIDPAIRVVLLMTLGGAMLAGGYAYVRRLIDRSAE